MGNTFLRIQRPRWSSILLSLVHSSQQDRSEVDVPEPVSYFVQTDEFSSQGVGDADPGALHSQREHREILVDLLGGVRWQDSVRDVPIDVFADVLLGAVSALALRRTGDGPPARDPAEDQHAVAIVDSLVHGWLAT